MDFQVIKPEMLSSERLLQLSAAELSQRGLTREEVDLFLAFQELLRVRRKEFAQAEAELESTQRKLRNCQISDEAGRLGVPQRAVLLENETRIVQRIRSLREHYHQRLSHYDVRFEAFRLKIEDLCA